MKSFTSALKVLALAGALSLGISFAYAATMWEPPKQTPPGGNTDAPINVGGLQQKKDGILELASHLIVHGTINNKDGVIYTKGIVSTGWINAQAGLTVTSPNGANAWLMHASDEDTNLSIMSKKADGVWDWPHALVLKKDTGDLEVKGNLGVRGSVQFGEVVPECNQSTRGTISSPGFPIAAGTKMAIPLWCNGFEWRALAFAPPPPTINKLPSITTIAAGQQTSIEYSSKDTVSCRLTGGGLDKDVPVVGPVTVSPSSGAFDTAKVVTYTIACQGPGGTVSEDFPVTIKAYVNWGWGVGKQLTGKNGESCLEMLARTGFAPVNDSPFLGWWSKGWNAHYWCYYDDENGGTIFTERNSKADNMRPVVYAGDTGLMIAY